MFCFKYKKKQLLHNNGFFFEVEHVKNIFESWTLLFFLFLKKSIIDDNTHIDEWVYPIIVENIYHNEVKDFPMVKGFPML